MLNDKKRPRVVIVGAGFGGLAAAKRLAYESLDVTLIDRRNYHLFQPLLYQVATAGLSPSDIAWPIRSIVRRHQNTEVFLGRVTDVDTESMQIVIGDKRVGDDYLLLATGARHDYFGRDEWEAFAPGLKKIDDATEIRRRILLAFERAEIGSDASEGGLNFVVVGAGPTGVELAGAIAELARTALAADFRNIDPRSARIILAEAGPRVLPTFPESLSAYTQSALERLGVEVRLGRPVTECDGRGVVLGSERIPSRTVLWAAGVMASPAGRWVDAPRDGAGRVEVNPDLSVPNQPDVFAIGDTAIVFDEDGKPLPGIAPTAKQQGRYVAELIAARVKRRRALAPFKYKDVGALATVGRTCAVIDFRFVRLKGWIAWWIWGVAHVFFLIGMRNRIIVTVNWFWSYLTFVRGARLITGED